MTPAPARRAGAPRRARAVGALLLGLAALLSMAAPAVATDDAVATDGPVVDVLRVSGPLDPSILRYLERALADAAAVDAEVVVVELDSTGLLDVELAELLDVVADREVPLVIWVGPPGARATAGAAWLAAAADVVAVAPATLLGAAAEPRLDRPDEPADAVGRPGSWLAERDLLDGAVVAVGDPDAQLDDSAALPSGLSASDVRVRLDAQLVDDGVVDIAAAQLDDVLRELDGRGVVLPDGARVLLDVDPTTARVRFDNQGLLGRMLHAVADPTLAYLLVVAGLVAIAFEVFQPGFGVAGIAGLATTALGAYGLTVLPTRPLMAALVVAGIAVLSVDTAVGGFGLATAAGATALAVGSVRLYGGVAELAVSPWLVTAVVIAALVFFVGILTTVLRAQGQQMRAGAAQVEGRTGVVRSVLNPEGHVFVAGALWRARAPDEVGRVRTGTSVRVLGTSDGLTLDVEVVDDDRAEVARAGS